MLPTQNIHSLNCFATYDSCMDNLNTNVFNNPYSYDSISKAFYLYYDLSNNANLKHLNELIELAVNGVGHHSKIILNGLVNEISDPIRHVRWANLLVIDISQYLVKWYKSQLKQFSTLDTRYSVFDTAIDLTLDNASHSISDAEFVLYSYRTVRFNSPEKMFIEINVSKLRDSFKNALQQLAYLLGNLNIGFTNLMADPITNECLYQLTPSVHAETISLADAERILEILVPNGIGNGFDIEDMYQEDWQEVYFELFDNNGQLNRSDNDIDFLELSDHEFRTSVEQVLAKISFNKNVNHARELSEELDDSCEQTIHRIIDVLFNEKDLNDIEFSVLTVLKKLDMNIDDIQFVFETTINEAHQATANVLYFTNHESYDGSCELANTCHRESHLSNSDRYTTLVNASEVKDFIKTLAFIHAFWTDINVITSSCHESY